MSRTGGTIAQQSMARPRTDLPDSAVIRALADAEGRLAVRVTPGARIQSLEVADGRLIAKVRVKPEDGKATAAAAGLLASALGIAPSRLQLLSGATARNKLFKIVD